MKKLRSLRAAAMPLMLACGIASGSAHAGTAACSAQTMAGLYVFSSSGYTISGGVLQPKAIIESIRFNGDGTLLVEGATRSVNGVVTQIPPGGSGTYVLEADCHGTLTFVQGPSFDIIAMPLGSEVWMIQTNPDNIFQGSARRVSR